MRDYSSYYPTYKEVILANGDAIFEEQLKGFEGKDVEIDGTNGKALIQQHQNPLNEFKQDRRITVSRDTALNRGNYVKTVEDGRIFLTLSEVNQNELIKYAMIRESNIELKFINPKDELVARRAITSAQTLYTTGIKNEKVIQIPDGMQGIQLPHDDETKALNRGDCFVFNKTNYKITFYDEVSYPGLLVLICSETEPSHLDDMVNEIADRWVEVGEEKVDRLPWLDNPMPDPEPDVPSYDTYELSSEPEYADEPDDEIWRNSWCKYTIVKYEDNIEVDGDFEFTLNSDKATVTKLLDNTCIVEVGAVNGRHLVTLSIRDIYTNRIAIEKEITIIGR